MLLPFPSPPSSNLTQSIVTPSVPTNPHTIDALIAESLVGGQQQSPTPIPSNPIGNLHKELGPPAQDHQFDEIVPLVEVRETAAELAPEVEGWLQKLDTAGDIKLPEPITHDGEVLLADSEAQVIKERIVLPLSQTGVQAGLQTKVTDSARWLAEWCVRLIKMMHDKVKYAPEEAS